LADQAVEQKLAAILAADVAGYSALMGDDERATVAMLDDCRAVFRTHVAAENGRVVDTAGDSVLAVFPSTIGAVRAALAVQADLTSLNEDSSENRRMRFRIGVNLGDVIEKADGTVYGDGVNIAARLESLAEPGGLTISGTTFDHVDGKLDIGFEYLGEKEVKNIVKPVRVYRVELDATETHAHPVANRPEAERPSIAVLAFENLSRDPDQEFFADGIAEDLITELSRLRWLLVTARNSAFTYKGSAVDVKQVGLDLGVRYVVEGSVRKGGERVRINAQLIDAATGNHIWAERYDRDLSDIFALQDEITETLVAALQGEVGEFERARAHRKPPENLDAWESYQRGLWHLWRFSAEDRIEAQRLLRQAVDLDPGFSQALAALGYALHLDVIGSEADFPLERLEQAKQVARQAIALGDKEAMGHFALGRVQILQGEYDTAITEMRTAIDLNPSSAIAHSGLGLALAFAGRWDQAISQYDKAIRLSPRDPIVWMFYTVRAVARISLLQYEVAVEDAQRAIGHPSANFWPYTNLAAALALLDRHEEAKNALDKLLEVKPDFTLNLALAALSPLNPQALRPRFKTWIEGLRKAGLDIPDEPAAAD
jgi:adenylate cyclase